MSNNVIEIAKFQAEKPKSNLIDFNQKRLERIEKRAKLHDIDHLQTLATPEMIQDWLGMIEHCMEEDMKVKIGGPKVESMFKALESIFTVMLVPFDTSGPKKA